MVGSGVREALGMVRRDLLTLAPQPMPPMRGPRALRRLPHGAIVAVAAFAAVTATEDVPTRVVAVLHVALLVVALWWPLPAWWLSLATLPVVALVPSFATYVGWAWAVHAGLLFLVALRNPWRVTLETVGLSLVMLGVLLAAGEMGPWRFTLIVLAMFAAAVAAAAGARGTREVRSRLAEQEVALAQERAARTVLEERTRIARELHDVVAHHMSVIAIQADAAPHRVPAPPEELVGAFGDIRAGALSGLTELRRILGVLRSEERPDAGSPDAPQPTLDGLDELVAGVRAAGLDVTTAVSGARRRLPDGVELSAYRIVQEALSNTLRHAPGAAARVQLDYAPDVLRLRVVNSPGSRPATAFPGAGHGIPGMRERAAMLGGDLTAGPTPDGGYEVAARLAAPTSEERPA
ncbi:sensor histidine kinase [Isoptericola sp. NPDC056578]|uniref:sensor histidine kinase n=1 Tax=unclassified Isoptericola TaxID=2623355 RepID=UPI00369EB40F